MVIVDSTAVNVALPAVGHDAHGDVTWLQWVVDGYTLSFAGLLLTGGALSERLGAGAIAPTCCWWPPWLRPASGWP